MHSKPKPSTLSPSELTSSLSSIARKQNLLAAVPPALRLLPLAALVAGDLYERRYGRNVLLEGLLGPAAAEGRDRDWIAVGSLGSDAETGIRTTDGSLEQRMVFSFFSPGPFDACSICARRGLRDGVRWNASQTWDGERSPSPSPLLLGLGSGVVYDRWRLKTQTECRATIRPGGARSRVLTK
jgi:hypothetical protein